MFPLLDLHALAGGAADRALARATGRFARGAFSRWVRVAGGRGVGRWQTGTGRLRSGPRGGGLSVLIGGSGRGAAGFRGSRSWS